ncbi:hypothetical protein Pelo_13781 [Pelomyxa schiedti]|nr:hypothetical protein Pelo_13781 [Pelomyxa schiedti]
MLQDRLGFLSRATARPQESTTETSSCAVEATAETAASNVDNVVRDEFSAGIVDALPDLLPDHVRQSIAQFAGVGHWEDIYDTYNRIELYRSKFRHRDGIDEALQNLHQAQNDLLSLLTCDSGASQRRKDLYTKIRRPVTTVKQFSFKQEKIKTTTEMYQFEFPTHLLNCNTTLHILTSCKGILHFQPSQGEWEPNHAPTLLQSPNVTEDTPLETPLESSRNDSPYEKYVYSFSPQVHVGKPAIYQIWFNELKKPKYNGIWNHISVIVVDLEAVALFKQNLMRRRLQTLLKRVRIPLLVWKRNKLIESGLSALLDLPSTIFDKVCGSWMERNFDLDDSSSSIPDLKEKGKAFLKAVPFSPKVHWETLFDTRSEVFFHDSRTTKENYVLTLRQNGTCRRVFYSQGYSKGRRISIWAEEGTWRVVSEDPTSMTLSTTKYRMFELHEFGSMTFNRSYNKPATTAELIIGKTVPPPTPVNSTRSASNPPSAHPTTPFYLLDSESYSENPWQYSTTHPPVVTDIKLVPDSPRPHITTNPDKLLEDVVTPEWYCMPIW